jgi:hypothetical protein
VRVLAPERDQSQHNAADTYAGHGDEQQPPNLFGGRDAADDRSEGDHAEQPKVHERSAQGHSGRAVPGDEWRKRSHQQHARRDALQNPADRELRDSGRRGRKQ